MKYYKITLLFSLICLILSFIFAIPYGLNFKEKEKAFEKASVFIISPNRGERKIKFKIEKEEFWLSCYGVEKLCEPNNINKNITIEKARILFFSTDKTSFLNGILLEYKNHGVYHINSKFIYGEDNIIYVILKNSIFILKLSFIFLLTSIILFSRRI